MKRVLVSLLAGLLCMACEQAPEESGMRNNTDEMPPPVKMQASLMSWSDLTRRPLPEPSRSIVLGDGRSDIVDLWLPEGAGPHPVVLMIHGGCWQKAIADRTLMNYAADALRQKGFAVWNIEYRGVDENGGGYPGTFEDVAQAADALRDYAPEYQLNLDRVVVTGHSAGGHLGVWLAGRSRLPQTSPLRQDNPLAIAAVLNVGGLADLEASAPITLRSCLSSIMNDLTGYPDETRQDVFSDTSPVTMLPFGVRQISVNGARDGIAPPQLGKSYTARVKEAGDEGEFVLVEGGHVELIAPGTQAFNRQVEIIIDLFKE